MERINNIFRIAVPVLFGVVFFSLIRHFTEDANWPVIIWLTAMSSVLWEGSYLISKWIDRKFSVKASLLKKLTWQLVVLLVFGMMAFNISYYILRLYEIYIQGNTGNGFSLEQNVTVSIPGVFLVLAIGGFQMGIFYLLAWQKSQLETERLHKEQAETLFQNLKHQISPHFLFNNLNTLNSLIHESPEVASKFLSVFSEVYRYSLQHQDEELVTLENELNMIESYLFLLKKRFEDSFKSTIEVSKEARTKYIPPMSLQLLVENAFKHNIAEVANPLNINIFVENDVLVVENNLQLRKKKNPSTRIGLVNLSERYRLLGQSLPSFEKEGTIFRVSLPLLNIGKHEVINN
ncbi:histidine kinase [Algoriphagus lutimaris]|uniref:sensor histidine kinase n=1 Tax=Algoriphagus lutimaris TaxID=613197 RepID=UPI00196AC5DB|nr:histidine kinase [Algoriphagus lutimaris]MBN3521026.1 histidine kinase [Algoriphagus lutimaris]